MFHYELIIHILSTSALLEETLAQVPEPAHFSFHFRCFSGDSDESLTACNLLLLDLPAADILRILPRIASGTDLILCSAPEDISLLQEAAANQYADLWVKPFSSSFITARFNRLLEHLWLEKDDSFIRTCLNTTINSIPDLIWFKDLRGSHEMVNDAFCHAVEGYFSPACDDITGYLAEKAMPMVYRGLKMMRPEMEMTPAFREQMYYGSLWAGLVLNAHGTSFPHPYGYVLTENHGIPHGKACAVFLPALLLHCAQYAPEKMERFLRVLDTDLPAVNQLLDSLSGVERISMTKEEIQSYRKRFTGLKHYANTPGAYSEEQGLRLFETLFLK